MKFNLDFFWVGEYVLLPFEEAEPAINLNDGLEVEAQVEQSNGDAEVDDKEDSVSDVKFHNFHCIYVVCSHNLLSYFY